MACASILVFIFLLLFNNDVSSQSAVTKVDPVLDISGNGAALFLFDISSDVMENGTCYNANQQAQNMIGALEWIAGVLGKSKTGNNTGMGIKVFDVCGSIERTTNILVNSIQCNDTTEIKGIFIYSTPSVQQVVEAYVVSRIPIVNFLATPSTQRKNTDNDVQLYSLERPLAAKDLLTSLNWTYFTVHHIDTDRAKEEYAMFLKNMSSSSSACLTESGLLATDKDLSTQISTKASKGAVIFATGIGVSTLSKVIKKLETMQKKSVIITDVATFTSASAGLQTYHTVVVSTPLPRLEEIKNKMNVAFQSYNMSGLDASVKVEFCNGNESMTNASCYSSFDKSYITYALIENFFSFYVDSGRNMSENATREEFQAFDRTKMVITKTSSAEGSIQVGEYRGQLTIDTTKVQGLTNMECSGWCPECYPCETSSTSNVNSAFTTGDLVISGLFPVLAKGKKSFTCGDINVAGRADQLVYSFIYAITTIKNRYPYLLPNAPVGYFVMDTCSDREATVQNILNFETCTASFRHAKKLVPSAVPGYIVQDEWAVTENAIDILNGLGKVSLTSNYIRDLETDDFSYDFKASTSDVVVAVVEILKELSWKTVIVISSSTDKQQQRNNDLFLNLTKEESICVFKVLAYDTTSNFENVFDQIPVVRPSAIVMFTSTEETEHFFKKLPDELKSRRFIITSSILKEQSPTQPLGALIFKQGLDSSSNNKGFQTYYSAIDSATSSLPWVGNLKSQGSDLEGRIPSHIIRSVDILLHGLNDIYTKECPLQQGLCHNFRNKLASGFSAQNLKEVNFTDMEEVVDLRNRRLGMALTIENIHRDVVKKVGTWNDGKLQLDTSNVLAYTSTGTAISYIPKYVCSINCKCVNYDKNVTDDDETEPTTFPNYKYYTSQDEFIGTQNIWATVVITIGCVGAFVTFIIIIYVLYKLCAGAIVKRHVGMGIFLLFALILLYLAVLPFTFTPSENVCAFQFLAPGITYAFVFAVMLVKMMTLREYKLIGLGGEVSSINQFLTVLFAGGVQVAVNVQWWVMSDSLVHKVVINSQEQYACRFERVEFIVYLSYVIALIVLNTLYSFGVRNEQRTTGDAKYLVASMICCILVWIAWIVVMFVLDRDFTEPTIAVGMLTCATLILLIMFIPKVHMLASMQYDVKQKGSDENGYKVDSDFLYERPYSLPGTLKTTYSESKPFSKTMFNFDDNLSY